jgi:hypothetical protein
VMEKILDRLNNGGSLDLRTIEDELRPFMAY